MNDVIRYAKQIKFQIQHVISTQSLCTILATHCKPFDLQIPEQWVFGYTLCVYPSRLVYS